MKTVSDEYVEQEEGKQKRPVELYHFWQAGGVHWYYTSGDVAVVFGTPPVSYQPAALERSLVKYNSQLEVTTCTISIGHLEDPALRFIAINPVEIIWVEISRLHRDMTPLEADVIFIGQMRTPSFQGNQAEVECVGFEHFLQMPVPRFRYQLTCNWKLFESFTLGGFTYGCKLVKASYKVSAAVVLDPTKRIISSASFLNDALGNPVEDGYWTLGIVEFQNEKRSIIAHSTSFLTLAFPMTNLENLDSVDVYPGCDGRPNTCRDKFDNVINSLWFAFIPQDNPAVRTP